MTLTEAGGSRTSQKARKPTHELRRSGLAMALAFAFVGGLFCWRHHSLGYVFLGLSVAVLCAAILAARWLEPVDSVLVKVARLVSFVMTWVILTLMYFLIITPMGLVMRLLGRQSLRLSFDPNAPSYWTPVERDGPGSRPGAPY